MNKLRIIAGDWRGRKISFADEPGLRPTIDRIRETAFNWLQADVVGARCLDVFAGSGALGVEALSRGADHVTFIDQSLKVIKTIESELQRLGSDRFEVKHASIPAAFNYLPAEPFDVVFLDPPYGSDMLPVCLNTLMRRGLVHDDTRFYIEMSKHSQLDLPEGFEIMRHKTTKRIQYMLVSTSWPQSTNISRLD